MKRLIAPWIAFILLGALLAIGTASSSSAQTAAAPRTMTLWLSSYDYWNNSPPGYGIEYAKNYGYPTVHDWACCRAGGTYADPITFAAQKGFLTPGTRVYIPWLKRYFILEDLCSSCTVGPQMDLWVGGVSAAQESNGSSTNIVNLWQRRSVVINPPSNEPVATGLLNRVRI